MSDSPFADVLDANEAYVRGFDLESVPAGTRKGLVVLTCMDSRLEPLPMLGLRPGDAKILRNAGARVTDDVLESLVLLAYLLGVNRAMVVAHTDCRMTTPRADDIPDAVREAGGPDTTGLAVLSTRDPVASLREDVERIRSKPYLAQIEAGGFLYDVATGRVRQLV